jgi:hypothetical protein
MLRLCVFSFFVFSTDFIEVLAASIGHSAVAHMSSGSHDFFPEHVSGFVISQKGDAKCGVVFSFDVTMIYEGMS